MNIIQSMLRYGGGFVKSLAVALQHADADNFSRIEKAFPEIFEAYAAMAEQHNKRNSAAKRIPERRMKYYCNDRTCGGEDCLTCYPGNRDIDLEEGE